MKMMHATAWPDCSKLRNPLRYSSLMTVIRLKRKKM